jgi:hypothetical protein
LEVEVGDLPRAENFLNQARSLAADDPKVETEWAYMQLKRAAQEAPAPGSDERAREAIEALEDAIARRGRADSYPIHVLGAQGLSWVRRAGLPRDERIRLMAKLRSIVGEGVKWHPYVKELELLYEDVDREYLMLGVAGESEASPPSAESPPASWGTAE